MGLALLSHSTSKRRKRCPISCLPDAPWPDSSSEHQLAKRQLRPILIGVKRLRHSQRTERGRFQSPKEGVLLSIGFYRLAGREYGCCPANTKQFLVDQNFRTV